MNRTIGFLTIGQAPRRDIVPAILAVLPGTRAVEEGALDRLDDGAVASLAPRADDVPLVTWANGREVVVGKRAVTPLLQAIVARRESEVDAFVVLCTGGFPPFATLKPVFLPDRLLKGAVAALWCAGALGIVAPIEGQVAQNREVWSAYPLAIAVASPYAEEGALEAAGEGLRRQGASLVVMNCMGFTPAMKERLRRSTGLPVLLPASVTGHMLGASL